MLESIVRTYRDRGGDVFLVRATYRVRQSMENTGFDEHLGFDNFLDEDDAISRLFYQVLDPAMCIYECPLRVFKECRNLPKRLDLIGILPEKEDLPDVATITAAELWSQLYDETVEYPPLVVDVREPREFRHGHIAGAWSVPLPEVASLTTRLSIDQPIVLVCRSSRRSHRAACTLISGGHINVSVLDGGMLSWESTGLLSAIDTFATSGDK